MGPSEGVEVGQPGQALCCLVALVGRPVRDYLRAVALVGEERVDFEVVGVGAVVVGSVGGLGLSFGKHEFLVELDADVVQLHRKHILLLLFLLVFANFALVGQ